MTIDQFNFAGKKAFVRVDFNVPLDENFNITDDTRMRAALPTLKKILADGGSIIIGSHLGRPKGATDKFSLNTSWNICQNCWVLRYNSLTTAWAKKLLLKAAALQPGEVLLLENFVFMLKKKANRAVWPKMRQTKKRPAKAAVKKPESLPRNLLLTLTAT